MPMVRSRRAHGNSHYFEPDHLPNKFQKRSMILKADQNSRKVHSAIWLIIIFGSWIALIAFVVSLFI